jgi:hypothetical protein
MVTLLTDFGDTDSYVAVVKATILKIDPHVNIIDLTHQVSAQNIIEGAFILGTAWQSFPIGTIHMAIVDPGVGTERKALLLEGNGHIFLAPDNGILSFVIPEDKTRNCLLAQYIADVPKGYTARVLNNENYWLKYTSSTFHARDIFAPTAGHLANGVPPEKLGEIVTSITRFSIIQPSWDNDVLVGKVIHIDHFGNVITTIPNYLLEDNDSVTVFIANNHIERLSLTYGTGTGLIALTGSHGYLEIAIRNGNAAKTLNIKVKDLVKVRRKI